MIWYSFIMFIKISSKNNIKYASIVSSYRENGITKHKQILNLGRLDLIENNPSFYRLGVKFIELAKKKKIMDLENISEADILNYGFVVVCQVI